MKMILGIIGLLAGVAMALYGNSLNNSIEAQLSSLFSSGAVNPGNTWLYGGIALAVVGGILLIVGLTQKENSNNGTPTP